MKKKLIQKALEISEKANIEKAFLLQKNLIKYIRWDSELSETRIIAGVDISYNNDLSFCSIVLIDSKIKEKPIIEKTFSIKKISFPYIPGLLFFREFPVFFECYQKLKTKPDLLIFDGHGLSHQRMMGIATMSGILLNKPSIGCAKSHLYGNYKIPNNKKYSFSELTIRDLVVGYVVRSKENVKPIFISTGFAVSPKKAFDIVRNLITNYKLPLPTHYAHYYSEEYKRNYKEVI